MINLLPPELTVAKGISKVAKSIRQVTFIALIVYILFGLGLLAFFLFSSSELNSLTKKEDGLKNDIKARETTEQRLVLLKDRVGKIKTALSVESASEEVVGIANLLPLIGASSQLNEVVVDSKKVDLSLVVRSSAELSSFLRSLPTQKDFTNITLTSFGFNPANGYILGLRLSKGDVK